MQPLSTSWLPAVFLAPACAIIICGAEHRNAAEFKADSNFVVLPLSITDSSGQAVLGLEASDFAVVDDGILRRVLTVSRWDAPTSIGVIFDASGSMKTGIRTAQSAVRSLLHENSNEDEAFLITFAESPRLEADFASNAEEISNTLLSNKGARNDCLVRRNLRMWTTGLKLNRESNIVCRL